MTLQNLDLVICNGNSLKLLQPESLFNPFVLGFEPVKVHTGCYRGYDCTYEVSAQGLYLLKLRISNKGDFYRPIDGISGTFDPIMLSQVYEGLHHQLFFTGSIFIGSKAIQQIGSVIGLPEPYSYRKVFEVHLEEGRPKSAKEFVAEKNPPWCVIW